MADVITSRAAELEVWTDCSATVTPSPVPCSSRERFIDLVRGGAAPSKEALSSEAHTVLSRLP